MGRYRASQPNELLAIPERLLARLWRERAARAGVLRTNNGRSFRVIYPGRPGATAGPDFRDALLVEEGYGLTRGDIELHVRQGDWVAHGHHRDHRYNSVALHVVYAAEDSPTPLANGADVPVVSMQPLWEPLPPSDPATHLWKLLEKRGYRQPSTGSQLAETLDRAGDERFQEKVHTFERLLQEEPAEQVVYAALMEGLGYSQNRAPFFELACGVPFCDLRSGALSLPQPQRRPFIEHQLLQTAGLLPSSDDDLELMPTTTIPLRWHLFRVRPGNHPLRRIQGISRLIERYLEQGLAEGLALALGGGLAALERGLVVRSEGPKRLALIGKGRARELGVNMVLPFAMAWGKHQGRGTLADAAATLYHKYPKTPDNEINREMIDLLVPIHWRTQVDRARRQQGLLHMQRLLAGADFRTEG